MPKVNDLINLVYIMYHTPCKNNMWNIKYCKLFISIV